MKWIPYSYLFLMLCTLLSCNNQASKASETDDAETQQPSDSKNTSTSNKTFYKRYEGTIANQPVTVYLQKEGNLFWGSYYYTKTGKPIEINGQQGSQKDSLYLYEYDITQFEQSNEPPQWMIRYEEDSLIGKWSNPNTKKSFSILLNESYPSGSYQFIMKNFMDSVMAYPGKTSSPQATSDYSLVWMDETTKGASSFNSLILQALYIHEKDLAIGIKKKNDSFFSSYKEDMKQDTPMDEQEMNSPSWNYSQSLHCILRYNAQDIVAIEQSYYSFLGGAHGNYYSTFLNIDMLQNKSLQLSDVLNIDSASLQKILETSFRKDYHLPITKPLTGILFDPYLATTDNFYISEKGLLFVYNPYEVAAYAVGQINVFVSYTQLNKYLREDFKKRIQL